MEFSNIRKKISYVKNKYIRIGERLRYPIDLFNFGNKNQKFIRAYHHGLGDNLAFSTLPEEFLKQKNIKTFLLKSSKFRNQEISDLVWGCNPFIENMKEGPWNLGDHQNLSLKIDSII